jgi:hypothetical protein
VTKREMARLIKQHVLPAFPELTPVGDLLVKVDRSPILSGFLFERSQMDPRGFRLNALVQPLYVPAEDISLGTAKIVGDYHLGDGEADADAVFEQVVADARSVGEPWLEQSSEPVKLAEQVMDVPTWMMGRDLAREIKAYSLIYAGRHEAGGRELKRLRRRLRIRGDDAELAARVGLVAEALDESPERAVAVLDRWADETRATLKLPQG